MVRSIWQGALGMALGTAISVAVLAWVGLAWSQTPQKPAGTPNVAAPATITVRENGKAMQCRVVTAWNTANGAKAFQLEELSTGEMLTMVQDGPGTSFQSKAGRMRSLPMRIFHWGRSRTPPPGVPAPPGTVISQKEVGQPKILSESNAILVQISPDPVPPPGSQICSAPGAGTCAAACPAQLRENQAALTTGTMKMLPAAAARNPQARSNAASTSVGSNASPARSMANPPTLSSGAPKRVTGLAQASPLANGGSTPPASAPKTAPGQPGPSASPSTSAGPGGIPRAPTMLGAPSTLPALENQPTQLLPPANVPALSAAPLVDGSMPTGAPSQGLGNRIRKFFSPTPGPKAPGPNGTERGKTPTVPAGPEPLTNRVGPDPMKTAGPQLAEMARGKIPSLASSQGMASLPSSKEKLGSSTNQGMGARPYLSNQGSANPGMGSAPLSNPGTTSLPSSNQGPGSFPLANPGLANPGMGASPLNPGMELLPPRETQAKNLLPSSNQRPASFPPANRGMGSLSSPMPAASNSAMGSFPSSNPTGAAPLSNQGMTNKGMGSFPMPMPAAKQGTMKQGSYPSNQGMRSFPPPTQGLPSPAGPLAAPQASMPNGPANNSSANGPGRIENPSSSSERETPAKNPTGKTGAERQGVASTKRDWRTMWGKTPAGQRETQAKSPGQSLVDPTPSGRGPLLGNPSRSGLLGKDSRPSAGMPPASMVQNATQPDLLLAPERIVTERPAASASQRRLEKLEREDAQKVEATAYQKAAAAPAQNTSGSRLDARQDARQVPTTPVGVQSVLSADSGVEMPLRFVPVPTVTVPWPMRPPGPPKPDVPKPPSPADYTNAFSMGKLPGPNGANGPPPGTPMMGPGFVPGYPGYNGAMYDPRLAPGMSPGGMPMPPVPPNHWAAPGSPPPPFAPNPYMNRGMMPYSAWAPGANGMAPTGYGAVPWIGPTAGPSFADYKSPRPIAQIAYPVTYQGPMPPSPVAANGYPPPGFGYPPPYPLPMPPLQPYYQPVPNGAELAVAPMPPPEFSDGWAAATGSLVQLMSVLQQSPYPAQREWAALNLASQDPRAHPEVVDALLTAARKDPAASVRVGCVACLGTVLARQPHLMLGANAPPVLSTLHALKSDSDPRVRQEAEHALIHLTGSYGSIQAIQPVNARQ